MNSKGKRKRKPVNHFVSCLRMRSLMEHDIVYMALERYKRAYHEPLPKTIRTIECMLRRLAVTRHEVTNGR
jgi:hypothetical protein